MRFGSCAYCHRVIAIVSGVRVCGSCHILDQRELVFESDQEIEEEDLMFRVIGPMRERMDGFFDRDEPFLIFEESDAYDSEGPPIFYHSDIDSTELYEEDEDPAFLIEEDDETSFMPGFEESDAYDSEGPPILYHSDIDSMELYDEDEDPRFLREIDDHDDHMFYIIRERLRLDTIDDASETLIRQLYQ
ncbi:hypothetical protein BD560DRAFT_381905 [Blakeslea trispora]|nr:hypothetical protein BD560DRAFT_381905 [Blakeslea trispora]